MAPPTPEAAPLDGVVVLLDGATALLEGAAVQLDGATALLEGAAVPLDGATALLEGAAVPLDGVVASMDGVSELPPAVAIRELTEGAAPSAAIEGAVSFVTVLSFVVAVGVAASDAEICGVRLLIADPVLLADVGSGATLAVREDDPSSPWPVVMPMLPVVRLMPVVPTDPVVRLTLPVVKLIPVVPMDPVVRLTLPVVA